MVDFACFPTSRSSPAPDGSRVTQPYVDWGCERTLVGDTTVLDVGIGMKTPEIGSPLSDKCSVLLLGEIENMCLRLFYVQLSSLRPRLRTLLTPLNYLYPLPLTLAGLLS